MPLGLGRDLRSRSGRDVRRRDWHHLLGLSVRVRGDLTLGDVGLDGTGTSNGGGN